MGTRGYQIPRVPVFCSSSAHCPLESKPAGPFEYPTTHVTGNGQTSIAPVVNSEWRVGTFAGWDDEPGRRLNTAIDRLYKISRLCLTDPVMLRLPWLSYLGGRAHDPIFADRSSCCNSDCDP